MPSFCMTEGVLKAFLYKEVCLIQIKMSHLFATVFFSSKSCLLCGYWKVYFRDKDK